MEYCDLPESSARTKSLLQTGKKELSCGCPTGAIKGRHIFPEKKNRKSEQAPWYLHWFPVFAIIKTIQ
jgi:hypothetical protein